MAWPLIHANAPPALARALPRLSQPQHNLVVDLTSAVGLGSMFAVVGVLLPSIARREGLDSMGLAVLAALPFVASQVTLVAGRIGARTPARMALLRALGGLGLLLVVIAPDPRLIALAMLGFWVAFFLGAPLQQRIWATIYSSGERGRKLGYVGTARSIAGTAALLSIALLSASSGWVLIVAVVALAGALCSLALGRMAVPGIEVQHRFSAADSIRSIVRQPMLRRIAGAQILFGAGFVAAPALIALVHVDRLGLDVGDIALAGLMSYGSTTVTFSLWGRVAGRTGPLKMIALGTLVGTLAMSLFAIAPDLGSVIIASMLFGAAGAAVDVAWPMLIADHARVEQQSEVAAGMNSIMGMRGLVVPFIVMAPIQAGIMDETGGLLMLTGVMAAGALLYARFSGLASLATRVLAGALAFIAPRRQRSPASAATPLSSTSGCPVSLRNRLMRSTVAGWVLKRPLALLSSFLTGLTM